MIEVYLLTEEDDRDYFIDNISDNVTGLCEQFGITLAERPEIPTAQLRYETITVPGRHGSCSREDGYDNVEISLRFNYISKGNARETYYEVSNHLKTLEPGITRFRLSDDEDSTYRILDERPKIEPLNNDIYQWGDFVIHLVLKPFRYFEWREVELWPFQPKTFHSPYSNAFDTPQDLVQKLASGTAELKLDDEVLYSFDADIKHADKITMDGEKMYTFTDMYLLDTGYKLRGGGDQEETYIRLFNALSNVDYEEITESVPKGVLIGDGRYIIPTDTEPFEDYIVFRDSEGDLVSKPYQYESVKHLFHDHKFELIPLHISFVASEDERFIACSIPEEASGYSFTIEIFAESKTIREREAFGHYHDIYEHFEHETEITVVFGKYDIREEGGHKELFRHSFTTNQGVATDEKIINQNKSMDGSFLYLHDGENKIETTTQMKFRPKWSYL